MRLVPLVRLSLSSLALALALAVVAGCPDRTVSVLEPAQAGEITKDIPVSVDIDLLFVIDNSGSTKDKQTVFAQNFPRFVQALDAFPKGRPNLHIGVVTTTVDLGVSGISGCPHPAPNDNGLLRNTPVAGCSAPGGRFLSDVADPGGGRRTNYSGSLDNALSCIAQVGDSGCGFEAPLEAMKRALDGTRPENAGFLRKGAFLVVVFLVDEDDASIRDASFFSGAQTSDFRAQPLFAYQCDQPISPTTGGSYTGCRVRTDSFLTPPSSYFEFLSTIVPPGRSVVALIGGDPRAAISTGPVMLATGTQQLGLQQTCSATINGNTAIGRPAIRLMDFVSRFGDYGLFRTVCQPDYSQTLGDIGELVAGVVSPCLDGPLFTEDVDGTNPGTQLECNVSDVQGDTQEETLIPRCKMQDEGHPLAGDRRPCWWTAQNRAACPTTDTGLELHVERTTPPAQGTSLRVRCATRADDR